MYPLLTTYLQAHTHQLEILSSVLQLHKRVIHLVCTHEMGRGSSNSVHHAYKEEGVDTSECVRQNSHFACICNIFFERCFHRTFLSLVTTFILLLCTTFAKVIFKLLIECVKNIPVRDGWEGQMGNSTYAMGGGVIASNHVRMISGKGSDFCHFGVYVLIE